MKTFGPEETAKLLPYAKLADSIREVALARGGVQAPPRQVIPLPEEGTLLIMAAADEALAMTKVVTVHPRNATHDLPTIQGEFVVMEAGYGRRLGMVDGATVTGRRTAALSLLAARELAPHPDGPLLIVGAGNQARAHLEAFHEGLGVSDVSITSRTRGRAEALADHARSLGMQAQVADSPEEALEESSLIVTVTTSHEPVLPEYISGEKFIAAVGAFDREMAELPPALVGRARVVVDTLEGAREEAGDLIAAEGAGEFTWEEATELAEVLRGRKLQQGPIVFKSVGHSLWDLAAARTAFMSDVS